MGGSGSGTGGSASGTGGSGTGGFDGGMGGNGGIGGDAPVLCGATDDGAGTCTASCPCESGEGSCTEDADCIGSLVCVEDAGRKFNFTGSACLPSHCGNDTTDGDETSQDCGGSCGCRARFSQTGIIQDYQGIVLNGVSKDGSLAVGYALNEGSVQVPITWSFVFRQITPIPLPSELKSARAYAANEDGSVIVGRGDCTSEASCILGGFVHAGGVATFAEPLLEAVSADGSIAVGSLGELWDIALSSSSPTDLQGATSISDDAAVVGGGVFVPERSAAIWTEADGLTLFAPLPSGESGGSVYALNDDGTVAVGQMPSMQGPQAFRWQAGGAPFGLGDLPGSDLLSTARDVSEDGRIVVGAGLTDAGTRAFIWDEAEGMRSLEEELVMRGFEPSDEVTFETAAGIGRGGTVIVGTGVQSGVDIGWMVELL